MNVDDDWVPTPECLDLAGEFMLQAVIEEYLRNGAQGEDPFNTAFAFGCPEVDELPEEPITVTAMRRLFSDQHDMNQQSTIWTDLKAHYINEARYPLFLDSQVNH